MKNTLLSSVTHLLPAFVALIFCGCAWVKQTTEQLTNLTKDKPNAVVQLYYATDRNIKQDNVLNPEYGTTRGTTISYGTCQGAIPVADTTLETTGSLWAVEPHKNNTILKVTKEAKATFFEDLSKKISTSKGQKALVFIHGYNESFDDAAKKTAQLTYAIKFPGAPIFYSWASIGALNGYFADEATIKWSKVHMKNFLKDFIAKTDAKNIYLIAHSMGNRGMTRAFNDLITEEPALASRFKAIILAAPDIDTAVFKNDIAPKLLTAKVPVTMYASAKDMALTSSSTIKTKYSRLGDGKEIVIMPGMNTIDITDVSEKLLGHNYFVDNQKVLDDLAGIIIQQLPPEKRKGLIQVKNSEGIYWKIAK